jgi:hypothetical protein
MKKSILLIAVLLLNIATCHTAYASVTINTTTFPDDNFRSFVTNYIPGGSDGTLTDTELAAVINIDCSSRSIGDLKGIEYFTSLQQLFCYNNQLTSLNISALGTKLLKLRCEQNKLTTLDVSANTALTLLKCNSNKLTTLNIAVNTALTELNCGSNTQMTSLDVSTNTALVTLYCNFNNLTTLNVSTNTALQTLYCGDNHNLATLTGLDNTKLKKLNCENCHLATLDLPTTYPTCTFLTDLNCKNNLLTTLNVTPNTELYYLYCSGNKLTTLNVSANPGISQLGCNDNKLAALNLSNNANLKTLLEYGNKRTIKVYSYKRSAAHGGGTGYYVPLTAQSDTTLNGVYYGPTKALGSLIDDAGQTGDPAFNLANVVTGSWGCATLGTVNGTQALLLSSVNDSITYQYNTGYTGTATTWQARAYNNTSVVAPNAYFTLYLDPTVITGVDGVESNDVSVYTTAGTINVGGSFDGNVNVYNLRGQQVHSGSDSEIAVPAGVYVVKVGGTVHKVLVR